MQYLSQTGGIIEGVLIIIRQYLIPIAFILALLYFFWGIAEYIRGGGEDKEKGKHIMIWGVVALFVMSSIWALINFIGGELGIVNLGGVQGIVPNISYP